MTLQLDKLIHDLRGDLVRAEPLARLTWLRVGGPADWLFTPADIADLQNFLRQCPADIPVMALGAGSNTLVRDGGVDGVVIHLGKHLNTIRHEGEILVAQAGCVQMQKLPDMRPGTL